MPTSCDHLRNEYDVSACPWCAREEDLRAQLSKMEQQRDGLRFAAEGFIDAVEAAASYARRDRGGQQVSFHGDFANIQPSVLGQLERFAKRFKDVGDFEYAVSYLNSRLESAYTELRELRRVIKEVDELADTQPSYWVVSIVRATQAALRRAVP